MFKDNHSLREIDSLATLAADIERIEQIKDPSDTKTQDAIDNFRTVLNFAIDPECPESAKPKIYKHIPDLIRRVRDLLSSLDKDRLVPSRQVA